MREDLTANELLIDLGGRSVAIRIVKDLEPLFLDVKEDDDIPFWADLWPAAVGLARHLWQQVEVKGQHTLELGAGLGLPGITAALKGAQVLETDLVAHSLEWARENAALNGVFNLAYLTTDWRNFQVPGKYEVILGSDILYETKLHESLEHILEHSLQPGGIAYLSDPGRRSAGEFVAKLSGQGWTIAETVIPVEMDGTVHQIHIYSLQKDNARTVDNTLIES